MAFFSPINDSSVGNIKSPGKSSRQIILWPKTSHLAYVSASGSRGFLRQFFFKNSKFHHFHRGDPMWNIYFRKNRKFLKFLSPKNALNVSHWHSKTCLCAYLVQIIIIWQVLGNVSWFYPKILNPIRRENAPVHHCGMLLRNSIHFRTGSNSSNSC